MELHGAKLNNVCSVHIGGFGLSLFESSPSKGLWYLTDAVHLNAFELLRVAEGEITNVVLRGAIFDSPILALANGMKDVRLDKELYTLAPEGIVKNEGLARPSHSSGTGKCGHRWRRR